MKIKEAEEKMKRLMTTDLVKDFILSSSDDEVFSYNEVADKLDLKLDTVKSSLLKMERSGVIDSFRGGRFVLFGNKKAITNLKKEVES